MYCAYQTAINEEIIAYFYAITEKLSRNAEEGKQGIS
jgi:hypothetical protein